MDEDDYRSLIMYYGREKFYNHMQNAALEGIGKFINDFSFRLFNGFSLVLGNRIQEGIRELNPIQNDSDLSIGAILALIYAHKRCNVVDKEALLNLDTKLKQERRTISATGSYYAGVFLFLSGKIDKAKEYADRVLKIHSDHPEALILKGWCELTLTNGHFNKQTLEMFDRALNIKKSIDANLGQVKYHQLNGDVETALNILGRISIRHPDINVPLVEKMKTQLGHWNWEHALETSNRILNLDTSNIEALYVKVIILLCRDGSYNGSLPILQQLYKAVDRGESTNADLFYQIAGLLARISEKNYLVLNEAYKFVDKAIQISPGEAKFITEMGYICILQEKYKEATKAFRSATKLDDSSVLALCGLTLCTILDQGSTEQARQQIEFLFEIQGDTKIPLLSYMAAKLKADAPNEATKLLIEACETQFRNLGTIPFGAEYLRRFDSGFLLDVVKELLKYSPIQQSVTVGEILSRDTLHITLTQSLNILDAIVKACPGMVEGVFLLARVQYLCGDTTFAARSLQKILQDIDPSYTEAHLLMAQIYIQQKAYVRASQSLEICLSHNFKVRENPYYHLLNGIIQKSQTLYDEAIKSFITAMNLSGITHTASAALKVPLTKTGTLSLVDRVTLYLEAIKTYTSMGQTTEANRLMQIALDEFNNTPEKGRLIISNADIFLQQGASKKALDMLRSIQPSQPYYLQAKTKMADIYLKHCKDRMGFAQCFKELVEHKPGGESYLMLGDAFMSIQEPDEAIDAYKRALKQNPRDPILASKLGRAYVKTHQYKKAISYYKEAIMTPENYSLKLDLAELYLKLKQFKEAEELLVQEIRNTLNENDDISVLQLRTKQMLLLARVHEKAGFLQASLNTLKEARDNQYRLQKRVMLEQNFNSNEQSRVLSKICVLMAEQSISLRDNVQAIHHYKEALRFSPQDLTIMAALARLHMQVNEMDQCQRICAQILEQETSDPSEHEAASVMMADLSFRKMDFDNAAYHFSQLLLSQPLYWTALARLIEVMRRSGTLQEVVPFLQRAEQACNQPIDHVAGLNYCKGMFEWYTGNPNNALRLFNNARRDSEWGPQSIFNMIEICLNPDGDLPSEGISEAGEDLEFRDSKQMALKTAERLINELKPRPGVMDDEALNHRLLEGFLLISTRQKPNVEKALNDFTQIASQDEYKENVGAIYGIATSNIVLKQQQRAKNQLKRVAKNIWTFEEAEYLEKSWLLLADIYIQANKYEMATELLERVLKHNKSCSKAYELSGFIAEKEGNYKIAAANYEAAWRHTGRTKPNLGYKLAYCWMKVKNYAEAIDVCQQVLKVHPDYPSIKKDILDKCRNNLRT
uniref:CSON011277 protein n=1 Tax=Culicoides sonorensis TaxID=179676 RepID=A0A336M386_CULSO